MHWRVSSKYGQIYPPLRACAVIERDRDCTPDAPHDFVQMLHAEKALTVQWFGHGPWLHVVTCLAVGQACPPNLTLHIFVERVRTFEPVPHDLEHAVYAPQALTTQSCGQGC